MPRYLIALRLPPDLRNRLATLQNKFRTPAWNIRIEPHITLIPPFETSADVTALVDTLLKNQPHNLVVPIQLGGVDVFRRARSVIYLSVKKTPELIKVFDVAHRSILPFVQNDPVDFDDFTFHITLANRLSQLELNQLFPEIQKIAPRETLTHAYLALYQFKDDGLWHPYTLSPDSRNAP